MAVPAVVNIGDVLYLRCALCDPPKMKFFLVVLADPLKMFVINSRANDFQLRNPDIMAALVPMYVSEHPFLDHDSLIGCHQLWHEYNMADLAQHLLRNPRAYRGHLSTRAKSMVADALRGNEYIPTKWLRQLLVHWAE